MTIHDIAKLAGVSAGTVSNVINKSKKVAPDTEKRIWKIIHETNYVPNRIARSMKSNNTRNILVISEDVSAFPAPGITDGICEYCDENDYSVSLFNLRIFPAVADFDFNKYLKETEFYKHMRLAVQQARAINASGILYVSIYPRDIEDVLPEVDIPVTYCYSYSHGASCCVNADDFAGAKMATEYLIQAGHKKIALVCGMPDSPPTQKRLEGYRAALGAHGLAYRPEYVVPGNGWHAMGGYEAFWRIMALSDRPTGVFAMNDAMALGIMKGAAEKGIRIPEDLSVHGYDNIHYTHMAIPPLTTISVPSKEIGRRGAALEIERIEKRSVGAERILLQPGHVERGSVGPPRE